METVIDTATCTGCGLCARVCPSRTIEMVDGRAQVTGKRCIRCDQCGAVCPVGAVTVPSVDPAATAFTTFDPAGTEPPGPAALAALLRRRRSCRAYRPDPLDREVLGDLVKAAVTAPSGTNQQPWAYTVLENPAAVAALAARVADYYRRLNRLAANPWARALTRLWLGGALTAYWREYYPAVQRALEEFDQEGKDPLFFHAPAVLLVSTKPGAPCPGEDALLAAGHILLTAESMGLGTCLIGFAVEALRRDRRVGADLALPPGETVRAVITVGRPAVPYARPAGRRMPPVRWIKV